MKLDVFDSQDGKDSLFLSLIAAIHGGVALSHRDRIPLRYRHEWAQRLRTSRPANLVHVEDCCRHSGLKPAREGGMDNCLFGDRRCFVILVLGRASVLAFWPFLSPFSLRIGIAT